MQPDYYVFFSEHESSSTIHESSNRIYFNMEISFAIDDLLDWLVVVVFILVLLANVCF
jgi:hypothetical protein